MQFNVLVRHELAGDGERGGNGFSLHRSHRSVRGGVTICRVVARLGSTGAMRAFDDGAEREQTQQNDRQHKKLVPRANLHKLSSVHLKRSSYSAGRKVLIS